MTILLWVNVLELRLHGLDAPTIKEESTTETEMPLSSRSFSEESAAGKGARNLALEEPEVEVKKKTVVKKKLS
jgi:hypothetical protein